MKRVLKACALFLCVFVFSCPLGAQNLQDLIKAAEAGNADSQYELGMSYWENETLFNDACEKSIKWLRKAALQNHGEAIASMCAILGQKYFAREAVPLDDADYMYWMIKGCNYEAGYDFPFAFCFVAYAYLDGIPTLKVERNYPKVLHYFQEYWGFRPAGDGNAPWWWEDDAMFEKISSLWDDGYEPSPTNEQPAVLSLVPNSVKVSNNGVLRAGEKGSITLQVKNQGKGDSDFSVVWVEFAQPSAEISIPIVSIPLIRPGEVKTVTVPINAGNKLHSGNVSISLKVSDPKGSETQPVNIPLRLTAN